MASRRDVAPGQWVATRNVNENHLCSIAIGICRQLARRELSFKQPVRPSGGQIDFVGHIASLIIYLYIQEKDRYPLSLYLRRQKLSPRGSFSSNSDI